MALLCPGPVLTNAAQESFTDTPGQVPSQTLMEVHLLPFFLQHESMKAACYDL